MTAMDRFQRHAQDIADTYAGLQDRIFAMIIDTIKNADYKHVTKDDVVLWQAEQLQKMGQLTKRTVAMMAKADKIHKQSITDLITFNGMQIADEVDDQIQRVAPEATPPTVDQSVVPLLDGIVSQTWTNLQNNVNETLITRNVNQSAAASVYRRILTDSTTSTVTGLMTHKDAVESAIYRAVDRGLPTRLIDRAGHRWSLEGYTSMVLNTTTQRTFNEVRIARMKDYHMGQALMSSHPNSRPACAWIQGHVVNIVPPESPDFDDRYDSIYNHGYGEPSGCEGINCKHVLFPFVPGVSVNHQPQYDPAEAIKNGQIVQQQRARERAIRDAKKRLMAAEELGDEDTASKTKTLIQARQAHMREFIGKTNEGRKNPLLARDYAREKVVTN